MPCTSKGMSGRCIAGNRLGELKELHGSHAPRAGGRHRSRVERPLHSAWLRLRDADSAARCTLRGRSPTEPSAEPTANHRAMHCQLLRTPNPQARHSSPREGSQATAMPYIPDFVRNVDAHQHAVQRQATRIEVHDCLQASQRGAGGGIYYRPARALFHRPPVFSPPRPLRSVGAMLLDASAMRQSATLMRRRSYRSGRAGGKQCPILRRCPSTPRAADLRALAAVAPAKSLPTRQHRNPPRCLHLPRSPARARQAG